jgi:hypothetical protein
MAITACGDGHTQMLPLRGSSNGQKEELELAWNEQLVQVSDDVSHKDLAS